MIQFNLVRNNTYNILYVIISGISGGKDEPLVQYIFDTLKKYGSVASIQFANDPLNHNGELPDMNMISMEDYFSDIDNVIGVVSKKQQPTRIVFVTHSFSAIVATYYLSDREAALSTTQYALITIDNDDSDAVLAYIDSLSGNTLKDKFQNPFSQSTILYMKAHKSTDALTALTVPKLHIDADQMGADHEFESDETKHLLVKKILAWEHSSVK